MRKSLDLKIFVLALLISATYLWQYFSYGHSHSCIVHSILVLSVGFGGLFFHSTYIYIAGFVVSMVLMYFNEYNNYSVFFFAYILVRKYPKFRFVIFGTYLLNACIVCELHLKQPSCLVIHILMCVAYFILAENSDREVLQLTDEELKILRQIEDENKTYDEVEGYSKPTVMRKLANACKRNNLKDNKELKRKYNDTKNQ